MVVSPLRKFDGNRALIAQENQLTIQRWLTALLTAGLLSVSLPAFVAVPVAGAQDDAKATAKKAGDDVKDAAKATGKAAKDAGKATKKAVESALPSDAPKDATGQCVDGTYTTAATRTGACSGHGGVKLFASARCTDGTLSFAKSAKGVCSGHGGVKGKL